MHSISGQSLIILAAFECSISYVLYKLADLLHRPCVVALVDRDCIFALAKEVPYRKCFNFIGHGFESLFRRRNSFLSRTLQLSSALTLTSSAFIMSNGDVASRTVRNIVSERTALSTVAIDTFELRILIPSILR